ncbi:hypothetical protein LOAG_17597 [Loa loa]|uniref:Tudor domain-containing protein n=1 Tax=Loa loa TaxID=7209 RepID=A0A1S0UIG4_LOALO|nr:hypothetical protein LOAG_17597 [Loa loa]EJD75216.1 hypothetical protein LOAG_17597 [Loa loa]
MRTVFRSKFEQDWTLQTLQLQFATILKRLDTISMPLTSAVAGTCSSFPNLTSLPIHAQSGQTPNTNWNPCSSFPTYQSWAQALGRNPSLSATLPNNLSLDPVMVQQLPPVYQNQQERLNIPTSASTQIMNPSSMRPSVGDFFETYNGSVPLITVPESIRPSSPTSTLASRSARICRFRPNDSEMLIIPTITSGDSNNNLQQREYMPGPLRKTQYGEPPIHVLNECYSIAGMGASADIQQQAPTKQYHQLENVGTRCAVRHIERGSESNDRLNAGGGGYLSTEPFSFCEAQEKALYVHRSRDRNGYLMHEGERQYAPAISHFTAATVCGVSGVVRGEGEDDRNMANPETANLSTIILNNGRSMETLKYKSYVPYIEVVEQTVYTVKRSDDDWSNQNWPLFFVQIQDDRLLDIIDQYLDCLTAIEPLPKEDIKLGTLCVSYCHAFQAMFRAVITAVYHTDVEVHYIDYGNYERVTYNDLHSISELPGITRMHPAVGIPCILLDVNDIDIGLDISADNDILHFMSAVSCEKPFFKLKFLRKRTDGVMVVELVDSSDKP